MIQYLVFPNGTTSASLQKDVIVNWSNVKYLKIDGVDLVLELNNGGNIRLSFTNFGSGLDVAAHVMQTIQDLVKSNPNGRVLKVKPDFYQQWGMIDIVYTAPSTGGSGVTSIVAGTNVTISPVGGTGDVTVNALGVAWANEYDLALGNLLQGSNPGTTQLGTTTYGIGAGGNLSTPSGGSPKDSGNTAFGFNALGQENTEGYNTAIGYEALGNQNVSAMFAVPGNTALGFQAGKECTTGLSNVFIGSEVASVNSGQSIGNVVVGSRAMEELGTGFANIAIGERAMQNVNSNTGNIAIGYTANNGNTTGNQNIVIGYNAQPSSLTVSNEITLGNSSTAVLRCQQTSITALSDERDKTSIEDLPYGLDFINKLQPRKFIWDNRAELREEVNDDGSRSEVEFYSSNKGKKDFGFIAQEVQAHDDDVLRLIYDENPDKLEMSYGKLVPILVKAIQELKVQLDNKQDK